MVLLQILAGGFYLLNKAFLLASESAKRAHRNSAQRWRTAAWAVYLCGLIPWLIIFAGEHNWIAAGVEASGGPAMVLGLVTALRGDPKKAPRWLDRLAITFIPLGFLYSMYDFGGLTTLTQWLEIGLVIGFLVGTYQLAKERATGYLWFMLMNVSCGSLMWVEGFLWLFAQQAISLILVIWAYRTQVRP